MNALATLINIAALACALLILWRVEPAIARMNRDTHWMIRYAMLLLAGGALPAWAISEKDLLPVDQAFALHIEAPTRNRIELRWDVAPGYYRYRHR